MPTPAGALVCIWYRVPAAGADAVIRAVRDIQRDLVAHGGPPALAAAEILLRSDVPAPGAGPAAPPAPESTAPMSASPPAGPAGDATLMETYRLHPGTTAAQREAFLATLDALVAPLAPRVNGTRHVEVFLPCAS